MWRRLMVAMILAACGTEVGREEPVLFIGAGECGNGILDLGEGCDTAIVDGPGKCPTPKDCDDAQACTSDQVIGSACQQQCFNDPITAPDDGSDGCCTGSDADPDCE